MESGEVIPVCALPSTRALPFRSTFRVVNSQAWLPMPDLFELDGSPLSQLAQDAPAEI